MLATGLITLHALLQQCQQTTLKEHMLTLVHNSCPELLLSTEAPSQRLMVRLAT